jgi:aminocarboxymuconate-semialdehyde decarboxylase
MIDIHSHVVPDRLPFGLRGDDCWPTFERAGDRGVVLVGGNTLRSVRDVAWNIPARLSELDSQQIALQVISAMPELFCYSAPPKKAERYCAAFNAWIADAVSNHRDRLRGLAVVPMQDPHRAAAMLADIKAMGLTGIEIGSNIGGTYAHDARFRPVYDEASRLGLAVLMHSFQPPAQHQLPSGPIGVAVSFPIEIESGIGGFVASGMLSELPDLRLAASHGGGGLAMSLARLDHVWTHDPTVRAALPEPPYATMRRIYFDTLVFSARALRFLVDTVGPDRVVVGSDYPFVAMPAGWLLSDLEELSKEDLNRIRWGNALAFLGEPADFVRPHAAGGLVQ